VLVGQNENFKNDAKGKKGGFYGKGVVIEKFENNSYLVKKNECKIVKKHVDV
jgi:hypothetical protein